MERYFLRKSREDREKLWGYVLVNLFAFATEVIDDFQCFNWED